jgi:GNAT superfamily N-acetyltransferase
LAGYGAASIGRIKMTITKAEKSDLQQILDLQYLAYQSEAVIYNEFTLPPLTQTLTEVEQEFTKGIFLKAEDEDGKIIGSVRAFPNVDGTYINKLIVHPDKQGQGIGTKLLSAIEQECFSARYELFTGHKSVRNIKLYERLGYVKFKEQKVSDTRTLVYMEKKSAMQIRKYTPADSDSLFALIEREGDEWKDYWGETGRVKYQKALNNSIVYLVFEGEALCGYLRCHDDYGFGIYVRDLLVDKAYRSKDYGRLLMERVCCDFPDDVVYVMGDVPVYYEDKLGYEVEGKIYVVKVREVLEK